MDELYSHECPACGGSHPRNETEMGINFSPEVLSQALRAIYDGMNVEDEIQRDAFEEMLRIFNEAADEGVKASKKTPPRMETFLDQLKYNNEVFSAFKVHRMQNDMAARLVDENGQLKPFEKWKRDVEDIADHYCNRWLQTEYDTAVLRAHQATDWLQFEAEKDVYPNLRWMPTTSPNPDEYHKQYWRAKLTLPINHPFWKSHRPGDRWNCKCSLRQTDEPATTEAIADFKPVPPQPGLDNNPAKDGKLFSDSHPYYTNAYPGAEKAAEKMVNDIEHYSIIETSKGKLRIHDGHGKHEREENIRIGKYLAEKHGYEIDLLDNPQNIKTADSYNRTLKIEQEYKMASTPTVNAIDRLIRDGRKQADNIVLWLEVDMPWEDVTAALRSRLRRCENILSVTIARDGKDIMLKREDILAEGFKIRPTDLK